MTHFGIICPMATGHRNPMTALGRELVRRGHRIASPSLGYSNLAPSCV